MVRTASRAPMRVSITSFVSAYFLFSGRLPGTTLATRHDRYFLEAAPGRERVALVGARIRATCWRFSSG